MPMLQLRPFAEKGNFLPADDPDGNRRSPKAAEPVGKTQAAPGICAQAIEALQKRRV